MFFQCGIITYIIIMKRKARFGRKFGLFTAFIEVSDSLTVAMRFAGQREIIKMDKQPEGESGPRKTIKEKSGPRKNNSREKQSKKKQFKRKSNLMERAVEKKKRAKG